MKTEEITGAENVFRALLDGRVLTKSGGLTMRLKDGLLIVSDGPRVLHLDLKNALFTYPVLELKDGGKYKPRQGECVLLSKPPKKYNPPWAGLVFHEDSVEAALYLENGRIYATKTHPLDIVDEWHE